MSDGQEPFEHEEDEDIESIHLTFRVGAELYAVGVAHVTEIVRLQEINSVPGLSPSVRGVTNLRGRVVPILDVRSRFGLPDLEPHDRMVIVVLEVDGERVGLMVEEVTEVVALPPSEQQPPWPSRHEGRSPRHALVKGLARRGEKLCIVLDVARLIAEEEESVEARRAERHLGPALVG